jgi:hypothetical protein
MNITFLSAVMPLTKSYVAEKDGTISKSSYPHAYEFTSHTVDVPDLDALLKAINNHADLGHCMLKGNITQPLVSQSRAGSTNTQDATDWLCLDIDGLSETITTKTGTAPYSVDNLMTDLGMGDVSYILQWSASYGISNKAIRCHVFVQIDRTISAPIVKQWLIQANHQVPALHAAQTLTKTGNSLSWALDITACQNDKLLYIAPPVLKGIKNPLGKLPRTSLVRKDKDLFTFPQGVNGAANRTLTDKRILELRAEQGMPTRKIAYKMAGGHEVMVKPDSCDATEIKQERGFVYFNINGGDSWGYYHPEESPEFIFNFKGEPTYRTAELLPDYWRSLQQAGSRVSSDGLTYLAFCDRQTGVYWKGTYDKAKDVLDILPAKNLVILTHFMIQHGMVPGDHIPEWDIVFDPQSTLTVDFDNKILNTFQLTEYMKKEPALVTKCPPTIFKFIHHALGSDNDITEHFLNWTACILQNRDRTLTSWVLHGTQGTGKGVVVDKILRPIFGFNQTTVRRMEEFKQPYNAYMKQCFIVAVDEVQTRALVDESGVMANIKNFITEPMITIRQMYASPVECRNFTNWVFLSNKSDPIQIDREDRRTNVAKYQGIKFYPTPQDLAKWPADKAKIEKELQAFHDYLFHFKVDMAAAGTPLDTEDRKTLIDIGENAIDTVSNALLGGNMGFFLDQLPTGTGYLPNALLQSKVDDYRAVIRDMLMRTDALTGRTNIARDELHTIFEYTVGKIPESPNKFTSLLKHHRIHVKKVWTGDKTVNGIVVDFKDVDQFGKYLKNHFPQTKKEKA